MKKVGSIYKWAITGSVFLCISEDLETFQGFVLKVGKREKDPEIKVGKVFSLNADSKYFKLVGPGNLENMLGSNK